MPSPILKYTRPLRFSRPLRYGGDPDVSAFQEYGISLGENPLSSDIIADLNRFVTSLKNAGVWNSFNAIYPIVGGTTGWHSLNLVDPILYRMTQNGTVVNDSNGTQGNGVNGYWDTGIDYANARFFCHYSRTDVDSLATTGFSDYGFVNDPFTTQANSFYDGGGYFYHETTDTITNVDVGNNSLGLYTMGIADDGDGVFGYLHVYKNGDLLGISNGNAVLNPAPFGNTIKWMFDGANFSPRQYSFFAVGNDLGSMLDEDAMLAMEVARYTAVANLQSALGREV